MNWREIGSGKNSTRYGEEAAAGKKKKGTQVTQQMSRNKASRGRSLSARMVACHVIRRLFKKSPVSLTLIVEAKYFFLKLSLLRKR